MPTLKSTETEVVVARSGGVIVPVMSNEVEIGALAGSVNAAGTVDVLPGSKRRHQRVQSGPSTSSAKRTIAPTVATVPSVV